MKITYWILAVLVIVLGIYFASTHSIGPREVIIMQPSPMQDDAELGYLVYRQLQMELDKKNLVVWGIDSSRMLRELDVVRGFLNRAQETNHPYQVVLVHEALATNELKEKNLFANMNIELLSDDLMQNVDLIKKYTSKNTLIVTRSSYSSHNLSKSWIQHLEAQLKYATISFTLVPLTNEEQDIEALKAQCEQTQQGEVGLYTNNLTPPCMSYRKSWYLAHKTKKVTERMAAFDRIGAADFILYLK